MPAFHVFQIKIKPTKVRAEKRLLKLVGIAVCLLAATACYARETTGAASITVPPSQSAGDSVISTPPSEDGFDADNSSVFEPEQDAGYSYIEQIALDTVAKFEKPGMSEYEKAKAAFDYMIEATSLSQPVGLELWRIRGNGGDKPSFVENRSLCVLLYGFGMCEDYAAAFTLLLQKMGLEAEYVPGLTYAANGSGLVDHAWTVAKIDGVWYHLDCQLEDNISRRDTTRYKYFMKSDATMLVSHKWGQNLIDSGLLTSAQNEEIAAGFIYEPCPSDYPTPPPHSFTSVPAPDINAIKSAIDAEILEYESIHGPLEPIDLNIIPPVFALSGFGPPD